MREAEIRGPARPALPMNPASRIWPIHNPNVIQIRSGAWANRAGD